VYLDVWERLASAVEDDSIRESALGGPDTSARAQVVWRVRADNVKERIGHINAEIVTLNARMQAIQVKQPVDAAEIGRLTGQVQVLQGKLTDVTKLTCDGVTGGLRAMSDATLRARVKQSDAVQDPCVQSPDAKYRGAENRLYRIEVHRGGKVWDGTPDGKKTAATFKWSRDNGSGLARWLPPQEGDDTHSIRLSRSYSFAPGSWEWVELTDDAIELEGQLGQLAKVAQVDGDTLRLTDPAAIPSLSRNPKVRRWDHRETEDTVLFDGAIPIKEGSGQWLDIEDGIQVLFEPNGEYVAGDYWLIPARVASGGIEWPVEKDAMGNPRQDANGPVMAAKSPQGVEHHYAPLGILDVEGNTVNIYVPDCRCEIERSVVCPPPAPAPVPKP